MRDVRVRELDKRCRIIVGVGALGSAKALARMRDKVPGVHVPDDLLRRIATADDQKREGKRVLIETIRALTEMEGVAGVHLMGHRNEDTLATAIVESGEPTPLRIANC
jgi:methylenetetrahydrofolate reductase (NADPH)